QECELAYPIGGRILLALGLVVTVGLLARGQYRAAQGPGAVALGDLVEGKRNLRIVGAQCRERARHSLSRAEVILGAGFLFLAQSNQQHTLGSNAGQATQQQCGTGLAADVAGLEGGHDRSLFIQRICRAAQFFVFVDTDYNTTSFCLGQGVPGIDRLCAKFHCCRSFNFPNYSLPMIFQRVLRRELLSTAGAVFTTLFTITVTVMLIRILGQAAGGKIASQDVIAMIGFTSLGYLPILLNLTGFIAVLMVISRSYQDSEMVVWFASGQSLSAWVRPVMALGIPLAVMTALLSMWVTPWAYQNRSEFQERFQKREDIARISPGRFQESSSADRVFFVEGIAEDQSRVRNVFVNTIKDGRTSIVVAREGLIETDDHGGRFLVLQDGRRYDGLTGPPDFQVMEFERYGVLVSRQPPVITGDTTSRALSTKKLLSDSG